ncbi:MAG: hypothetical protein IJ875_04250, partial [Solobacterium sp.]|nr:hypothetical protein [Solobacterium sp.]
MTKEKKKKDYRLLIATVVLFIASVAFWVYIGHYARRLSIYNDELLYYSYAQNLVQGRGFPVVYSNIPYDINRYVYSILISPAFYMSNRYHQFQVLALINATIMSSAIIPLALLAKKMLLHFKTQLMALILFVVSADFCITLFYMADISFFTINIWMFYFAFCIFKEKKKKALYALLFGIFAGLSMLNKRSSVIVIVAFSLTVVLYFFTEVFRKRENRASIWQYVFALVFLAGFAYLGYRLFLHFEFDKVILTILDRQKEYLEGEDVHIAQRFIYYALQLAAASLYLPFALPVLFPERLKKEDRFLLIMVILTFIGFSLVEFHYSFGDMYD